MKNKMKRPYEMDKFFKKWLVGLSERTKKNYTEEFQAWRDFVGMTPTEQIEKRLKDLTSGNLDERQFFENKFRGFKEHLEKRGDLKPSAVRTLLTPVASFFSRNGLPLALKRGDWETTLTQPHLQATILALSTCEQLTLCSLEETKLKLSPLFCFENSKSRERICRVRIAI